MTSDDAAPKPRWPFVVLSLPRSRSAWMAHWLSYPGCRVGHDIAIQCNTAKDFIDSFKHGLDGTVETGAMIGWRLLRHAMPGLRTLVVMRSPDEVVTSLLRKGMPSSAGLVDEIYFRAHMLSGISAVPGVRTIQWQELDAYRTRCELFEWLLNVAADDDWDARFAATNIQIDFAARMVQLAQRAPAIAALKQEIVARQLTMGLNECLFH